MGFHLDTTGNIWLGSGAEDDTLSDAITAGPPNFYVSNTGSLYAVDGSVGGLTIDSSGIYANYDAGNTGFKIFSSDGSAEFEDVIARGTISGTVDTTLSGGSGGYLQSGTGSTRVRLGAGGGGIDFLNSSATKGIIDTDSNGLRIRNYDSTTDKIKLYAGGLGGTGTVEINAEVLDINGSASSYNEIQISGFSNISISGNSGTPGQLLTKTNTGIAWQSSSGHNHSGYTFPNSGELLSNDNHSHGTPLTSNHENAANPHDNYLQEADHNSNNTAHSNFLESADLSGYVQNNDSNYLSAVGHTAMVAANLGYAHGLNLADVLTNSNHSHGNIHSHTGTVLTTAGAGNLYSEPGHGHNNYANSGHGHNEYASNSHGTHVDGNVLTNNNHSHGNIHSHTGTVLTTAGAGNLYSEPHNSHSHNHSAYVTNSSYSNHLQNLHGFSDQRLKTNIIDTTFGLAYLNSLRPVDYEFTTDTLDLYFDDTDVPFLRDMYSGVKHGFIAQEVRTATFDNHASNNAFGGLGIKAASDEDVLTDIQTLDLEQLVGPMVKAIQELSAKIDLLESRVEELEGV